MLCFQCGLALFGKITTAGKTGSLNRLLLITISMWPHCEYVVRQHRDEVLIDLSGGRRVSCSSIISFARFYYLSLWFNFASRARPGENCGGGSPKSLGRQWDSTGKDGITLLFAFPLFPALLRVFPGLYSPASWACRLAENKNIWHLVKNKQRPAMRKY